MSPSSTHKRPKSQGKQVRTALPSKNRTHVLDVMGFYVLLKCGQAIFQTRKETEPGKNDN